MEIKPTTQNEMQINDADLDEVVGGKEVLDLQQLKSGTGDDGCVSSASCVSSVSTNS